MGKRFWIITTLLVAGFIGFLWIGDTNSSMDTQATPAGAAKVTHISGKQDAAVSLVEYSDFQCPACGAYYPVIEQVIEKYKDQISFEYRHYPLTTIHQNAFAAARASEAAGKQGAFWEMYRLLFANQAAWSGSGAAQTTFEGYAKQLRLDINAYKTDFASSETNSSINASIKEFNALGLPKSTPTFLLNGKKIEVRNNLEDFSKLIDRAVEQ
jgi:protein-disulfide isomerase